MKIFEKVITLKNKTDKFSLIPTGDWHYDKNNHDPKYMNKLIELVKKYNAGVIECGDSIDCINHTDRRYDPLSLSDEDLIGTPAEIRQRLSNRYITSAKALLKRISPIKDNIWLKVIGNHCESVRKYHSFDVHQFLCENIGCFDGEMDCWLILKFKYKSCSRVFRIFVRHKPRGGTGGTVGNKYNATQKMLDKYPDADLVLCGHIHQACKIRNAPPKPNYNKKPFLEKRIRYGINVGCALTRFNLDMRTYEEDADYSGGEPIIYRVEFCPFTQKNDPQYMVVHEHPVD